MAFAGSLASVASTFLDGAAGVRGFFPSLVQTFGDGAFEVGGHRFARFLDPERVDADARLVTPRALRDAWRSMRDEHGQAHYGDEPSSGPLALQAIDAGLSGERRLQRALTRQMERARATVVQQRMMRLPADSEVRRAWLDVDIFSHQFLAQWPTPELRLDARDFREEATSYLGLRSPEAHRLILSGRTHIPGGGRAGVRVLDPYAHQAELATLTGDSWRVQHDAVARVVTRDVLEAGFAGTDQPRRVFTHAIAPEHLLSRGVSAIVPDLRVRMHFPDLLSPARWRDVERDLFDFKCAHGGCPQYRTATALRERSAAVAAYARSVHTDVLRHARDIDTRLHATPSGSDGPVTRELLTFPRVHGLVFGARSEASPEVHALAGIVAGQQAGATWRAAGASSRQEAYGFFLGRLRRRWGCVASREHARMRLARLELVGSRGRLARPHAAGIAQVRAIARAAFQEGLQPAI